MFRGVIRGEYVRVRSFAKEGMASTASKQFAGAVTLHNLNHLHFLKSFETICIDTPTPLPVPIYQTRESTSHEKH